VRWSSVPIVLVVAMLLGSVLIPARQTWRIMQLLRETTTVIEPVRLLGSRLELGLSVEAAAIEAYALTGDPVQRARYVAAAADDDRRLVAIETLARSLDAAALERAAAVRSRVGEWREINRALVEGRSRQAPLADVRRAREASYVSALGHVTRLASYLAAEESARQELIRGSEQTGLVVNASLVFVALGAVIAVGALSHRERRLTGILQRRVEEEAALREAAEALAAAFTIDDVTQQIARTALDATRARGAFVEQIGSAAGGQPLTLVVRASAGVGVPAMGATAPCAGSYSELVLEGREPVLVADLARAGRSCTAATMVEAGSPAIVVPLGDPGAPLGALFIVGAPGALFRPDDLVRIRTFGHLAELAYEKVRLLDEAREGRLALERVMQSRSRLMRGFSHDVKNPLGAADGYASLLSDGLFGALSVEQRERVERIRSSIGTALGLIDDLHELARTEAGHIVLTPAPVDLAELVRAIGEQYRAAAEARGLSLLVEERSEPLRVETDRARVQQIVANLLSNAIKYTADGSVALRVGREPGEQQDETAGWAAIEVRDTGRGIPAEKQHVIFEEFVRLDSGDQPGVGLGLAISQKLAQALGGRITVHSEGAGGSTFVLRLPLREPDA
jgi:signal transduction histidine kinase